MKVVLQRVSRAAVRVDGREVGAVGTGHVLLVGFGEGDAEGSGDSGGSGDAGGSDSADGGPTGAELLEWMARKVVELRVFADDEGRMNRSLEDVGGGLLVISQFTLYGDARKGRRPSFVHAADPDVAEKLYDDFVAILEERLPGRVASGEFGATMEVELVNDGPVTLVLER